MIPERKGMTPAEHRAVRHVLDHVAAHRLARGERVPGIRPLARQAGVSTEVMARALSRLRQSGVLQVTPGAPCVLVRAPVDPADVFAALPAPGKPFSASKAGLTAALIQKP